MVLNFERYINRIFTVRRKVGVGGIHSTQGVPYFLE